MALIKTNPEREQESKISILRARQRARRLRYKKIEKKKAKREKKRQKRNKTRRQEASCGQRYPCPALYSFWVKVGL